MTRKTTIIADDHPVFRVGLAHIINGSEDFAVVAEAENTEELFDVLESTPCDMVILDMRMEGNRDGIIALKKIKETYPEKKVLIMSQVCSLDLVDEAMNLGADGYVTKNDITEMLLPLLKSIDSGETVLSPRIQSMMMNWRDTVDGKLTPRENDILRLSVKGLSQQDIARQLNITISTVNFHRQNIKGKLQADNIAGMIRIAYEKGLV